MRLLSSLFLTVVLAAPLSAGDYDLVIKSATQVWPERRTVVVACNKDASSMALMDLGSATEKVISLLVVDILSPKGVEKVIAAVSRKPRSEIFVLIVSDDPVTGDGTESGRALVSRFSSRGIPSVGTTKESLKMGAVFAQGPGTGDKMLTNPEAAKKVGVALPEVLAPAPAPPPAPAN